MPSDDSDILLPLPSVEDPEPEPPGADPGPTGPAETFALFDDGPAVEVEDGSQLSMSVSRSATHSRELLGRTPVSGALPSDPFAGGPPPSFDDELPEIPGYRLLSRIGRGGMGEVHLAERLAEGGVAVRCALKLVHPGRREDPVFTQQILSEARIAAQLRHPNIVGVFDVGRVGEHLWLAMEWVDGCDTRTLRTMARERQADIPLRHVAYIVREAVQGLHHAHTATTADGRPLGIVHRDISLGNILVSRHGAVKLADFGVAAAVHDAPSRLRLAGKPHYLAPELYRGAPASVQSDIFAMGVTIWELVTMEALFGRHRSFQEYKELITSFDPRQAFEADLTMPDGLEHVLLRALAADPDDRYGSALELLEDLSDFAYEAGLRLLDAHFARYVQRSLDAAG